MKASELKDLDLTKERKCFAVMIGMYLGAYDSLKTISEIVSYADKHDFDMKLEYGRWVIDTEKARSAAMHYAKVLELALL